MSETHTVRMGTNGTDATRPHEDRGARLMRRAPTGYLWNQAFALWQFLSLFLINLVLVRSLTSAEYGVYAIELTASTAALYIAAIGLESSGSVFLPRVLADEGPGQAMTVVLELLALRVGMIVLVAGGVLYGLPVLAEVVALSHIPAATSVSDAFNNPALLNHRGALAFYAAATSFVNLLAALLTSILRTRIIFIAGSLAQLVSVGLIYVLIQNVHAGVDGALVALALPAAAVSVIYAAALIRAVSARPQRTTEPVARPMVTLGVAAWASDLANGSLLKSIALALLGFFAATATLYVNESGAFNITYEMGHAAALLFVAGLGGVGLAVMSVSYATREVSSLAVAWRTVSKLQVVLAVPLVAFCVPHAEPIMVVLFGQKGVNTGGLLALFLGFNALVRLAGGGAHSAALYVLGRQRWVVISSWGMLGVLALSGLFLVPRFGVAGALAAVGVAQLVAELAQMVFARYFLARPYPVGFMLRVCLALLPAMAFALVWRPTSFFALFLAGLGYLVLFVLALLLIRPLDAEDRALLAEVSPRLRALLLPFTQPARARSSAGDAGPGDDHAGIPTPALTSASTPLAAESE